MSGLLSGLKSFGLGSLEEMSLFDEEKEQKPEKTQPENIEKKSQVKEEEFLFDKTYQCPVCDKKVMARTLRTGKARLLGTDMDMRPRFAEIEPLKYDVILCKTCGFTALTRFFTYMTSSQKKAIMEKITKNFVPPADKEIYTFEEATERYKMALACSIVRGAKNSEKAYTCLKMGWLSRSWLESLQGQDVDEAQRKEIEEMENASLKNALDGFVAAVQTENFPICGMDEMTVNYLLATLAFRFEKFDIASKMVSVILTSRAANSRVKDKARDLKEKILEKMKDK